MRIIEINGMKQLEARKLAQKIFADIGAAEPELLADTVVNICPGQCFDKNQDSYPFLEIRSAELMDFERLIPILGKLYITIVTSLLGEVVIAN